MVMNCVGCLSVSSVVDRPFKSWLGQSVVDRLFKSWSGQSVVDRLFKSWAGQTKDFQICICCF